MRGTGFWFLMVIGLFMLPSLVFGQQDEDLVVKFVAAIENGDADVVRELLESGADANMSTGDQEYTLLMKAAWNRQEEIARLLLDAGAKVNAADSNGQTALMLAATQGSLPLVEMFIDAGADLEPRNAYSFDAFTIGVSGGHIDIARRMLKAKADIESSTHGLTPLMFAVSITNEEMMRFLVDNGANVNAGVRTGMQTPLNLAGMTGNVEAVRILIELKADVNGASKDGTTPTKAARDAGHENVVAMLKKAGAK